MSAEGMVLIIGAVSAQLLTPVLAYLKVARSVGTPNGLGTVHEALHTIDSKLDNLGDRVTALEGRQS